MRGLPTDSATSVNPNQRLVRRFHAAQWSFYGGETGVEAVGALLTDEVAWHVPGRNPIAGDYRGKPRVLDYFARRRDGARGPSHSRPQSSRG